MQIRVHAACVLALMLPAAVGVAADKRADRGRLRADDITAEDLFHAGYDLCRQGQCDLAIWPLKRAATLARDDPGLQLWLAHAFVQTGQLREGKSRLLAAEKLLVGPRRNGAADASLYLACVRNYLGVVAALDHSNADAVIWLRRAVEPSKEAPSSPNRSGRDGAAPQTATTKGTDVIKIAEANKRLLDAHASFTWWVAPDEPLPNAGQLKSGPGLAGEYAKAAAVRWRREVAGENADRDAARADPAPAPEPSARTARGDKAGGRAAVAVPPLIVQLLDQPGALTQAKVLARIGDLNEALRLADASRTMQPGSVEVYLVLADLFEAKGWLREALESLDTAATKATAADQKQLARDRAATIAKEHLELMLEPKVLFTSRHFRLRFDGPASVAQGILTHMERAHDDALRTFGLALPVVYVRMFPDRATFLEYTAAAQKKPPASWLYASATTSPHSPGILASAAVGFPTLSHEYAHLITRAIAGPGDLPHWLNEGISEVVKYGRATETDAVRAAALAGRLPRLEDVEKFFSDADLKRAADNDQATVFYDMTRCAVSFFLNTYGDQQLVEWLLLIRRGEFARQSFMKLTGLTWERFFQRWAETCLRPKKP